MKLWNVGRGFGKVYGSVDDLLIAFDRKVE